MAGEPRRVWAAGVAAATALTLTATARLPVRAQRTGLDERLVVCASCHGANGVSTMANTPSLAGHPVLYTQIQLFLFREGQRKHEIMNAMAQGLSDEMLTALAEHYATLPPVPPVGTPDPALDERGRGIAVAKKCASCHMPDFAGRDQIPRLAGQREDYLLKALRDYKTGARAGEGAQMAEAVYGLADDDLRVVAHHVAHVR